MYTLNCSACAAIATAYRALAQRPKVVGIGQHPVYAPADQRIADALYARAESHDDWHMAEDARKEREFEARMVAEGRSLAYCADLGEEFWMTPAERESHRTFCC